MTFYLSAMVLTGLLLAAMTLHVSFYSGLTTVQRNWYQLTFLSVLFCAAAEYAVHCGFYDAAFALPLTVITVLQFSVSPMLGVLFSGALGLHTQAKNASLFFCVNAALQVLAAPFGLIFYFNRDGYFRGPLFFVYELFYCISLVYVILSMVQVGKSFRHRDIGTIVMILVILLSGIVPMTFFKLNIAYMAIAMGASLCYIYYNDLVQQDIQAELVENQKKLSGMQEHIIFGLANLIESRDMETGAHITRTSDYVKTLAECARSEGIYQEQLTDHFIDLLHTLAPMHDIGKILIPDSILKKPGRLTPEEYMQMQRHASEGGAVVRQMLSGITDAEYLSFASDIATYHHERWDGSGYPARLKGAQIPLPARIMAIADVFDALVSERCYKRAMPRDEAIEVIRQGSGTHFDPQLVTVFLKHSEAFETGDTSRHR